MSLAVYRAPMRSRRDDVAPAATIARAKALSVCGFGGVLSPPPGDVAEAVELAAAQHDDRLARRIARFAEVPVGSYVWTRDDGLFWLGRLCGPWRYDASAGASEVDLVHVRPCEWREPPLVASEAPAAVLATYGRGGRNFQRINDASVLDQTQRSWDRSGVRPSGRVGRDD